MVMTLARHMAASSALRNLLLPRSFHRNHDAASRHIDHGTAAWVNGRHHGVTRFRAPHLDEVASAEIMQRDDAAERGAILVHHRKPDQVGVIELVAVRGRRQPFARTNSSTLRSRSAALRRRRP